MDATETQELRARFRGELVVPGHVAYDGARKLYDGMIDRRPALIVKCSDVVDVIAVPGQPEHQARRQVGA